MHAILQKKPEIKKISQDKNQGVGLNRNRLSSLLGL